MNVGRPAEFRLEFAEIDRIAEIVPGTVRHEFDQFAM